ncbi:hypothetical protein J2X69_002422 [Algoriphagus sp. 4150]|nr:hypothetical protein [Algoriphagus sp. 4150]
MIKIKVKVLSVNLLIGIVYVSFIYLIYMSSSGGDLIFKLLLFLCVFMHFISIWFRPESRLNRWAQLIGIVLVFLLIVLISSLTNLNRDNKELKMIKESNKTSRIKN